MKKHHPKILKLAEIMQVNPYTIIMEADSFEIYEIYDDQMQQTHYKIVLTAGGEIIKKKAKTQ
jgi:hypothetical protein